MQLVTEMLSLSHSFSSIRIHAYAHNMHTLSALSFTPFSLFLIHPVFALALLARTSALRFLFFFLLEMREMEWSN